MATGTVKWFNETKGFGFISTSDGKDLFVHSNDIETEGRKTLREGEEVTFETGNSPKGPKATNVRKA